jgi:hypothetical protein
MLSLRSASTVLVVGTLAVRSEAVLLLSLIAEASCVPISFESTLPKVPDGMSSVRPPPGITGVVPCGLQHLYLSIILVVIFQLCL